MEANRTYKDSIIRALLNSPKKALRLYCDITGKEYDEDTVVEMKSIEVRFLPNMRNDMSFIINGVLVVFIEHQSTLNPNMPLRILQYILMFFAAYFKLGVAQYKETLIRLPRPEFYVLYNGRAPCPPETTLRLSDAFMGGHDETAPSLELVVKVININKEHLTPALQRNEEISGYAEFVAKVNSHMVKGLPLTAALRKAVDECVAEGILPEFFKKYRNEVESMFTLIYDEDMARKVAREEGMEKGVTIASEILKAIKQNLPTDEIAERYNVSAAQVEQLRMAI